MWSALIVTTATLSAGGGGQESGSESELPDSVVARVNGVDVPVSGYGSWLLDRHGWAYLGNYLEVVALRQEAKKKGVTVGAQELEQAFQRDWDNNVLMRFRGDESKFVEDLDRTGMGRAGWRARRMQSLETEELCGRLAILMREPTAQQLRVTFEQEFGEDAIRKHLRVAFFDRMHDYTLRPGQLQVPIEELNRIAMDRANAFLAAVKADPAQWEARIASDSDLCLLPRWDSYVRDLREFSGDLPRYKKAHFDGALDKKLLAAKKVPGEFCEPLLTGKGVYVVEVISWEKVNFEDTKSEIEEYFLHRLPTPQELYFYKQGLLERSTVVKNPAYRVR